MKKKVIKGFSEDFVAWKIRSSFVSSLSSFVIGFLIAWLIWAQTASYMFAIMRP